MTSSQAAGVRAVRCALVGLLAVATVACVQELPLEQEPLGVGQASGIATPCGSRIPPPQSSPYSYIGDATLLRWLERAYVEADGCAGFGDYPAEQLDRASLQQTWAAISVLGPPAPAVVDPLLTSTWVKSLRLPNGLYDDPVTEAPALLETSWALRILDALDIEPGGREFTLGILEEASDGFIEQISNQDRDVRVELLSDLLLIATALELLEGDTFVHTAPSLARLRNCISDLLTASASRDTETWSGSAETSERWLLALVASHLFGGQTPEAARQTLSDHLGGIATCPPGYLGESQLLLLLDASSRAFEWETLPSSTLAEVAAYLDATMSAIPSAGAYCWSFDGWHWVDPALNESRAQLYLVTGEDNPSRRVLVEAIDRLRCSTGYSALIEALPSADFTYFGTRLALASGAPFVGYDEIRAYAECVLLDPQASAQDLLYGVRTLLALDSLSTDRRCVVATRIAAMNEDAITAEAYWLAPLLLEAHVVLPDHVSRALADASRELLPALADPQMGSLRLIGQLARLSGEPAETSIDDVLQKALELADPGGGFRWSRGAPSPDLASVYCVTELLSLAGRASDLDPIVLREFVASCWSSPGFSLSPPRGDPLVEAGYVDLFTTYMGIQILSLLDERSP